MADVPEKQIKRLRALIQEAETNLGAANELLISLVGDDGPLVEAYRDSVQKIIGKRPEDSISLGGSDACYFTNVGIPCIISCPLGGGHHSDNEWLDQASFEQFVPILREFLNRTAKFTE